MRFPSFQGPMPEPAWVSWLKWLLPSGLLGGFGVIIGWRGVIRPAITRLVFYFLRHEDGQLLFQKYFGDTMVDQTHQLSQNTSAVRTLQATFERFEAEQRSRDASHAEATASRDDRMEEIANSVTYAVTRFDNALDRLTTAVARLDGATEERRFNDSTHTHRRRDDGD